MKERYVPIASPPDDISRDFGSSSETITVYEPEDKPINTGLLDIRGTPIYRIPKKFKIGF